MNCKRLREESHNRVRDTRENSSLRQQNNTSVQYAKVKERDVAFSNRHPQLNGNPSDLEHKQAFESMFIPVDDQHGITSVVYKTAGNRSISNLLEMEPDGSEGPVV
jgi:hypothetical protein